MKYFLLFLINELEFEESSDSQRTFQLLVLLPNILVRQSLVQVRFHAGVVLFFRSVVIENVQLVTSF